MPNIYDDDMLFIKVATIGTDENPTLVRMSICRFNINHDDKIKFDEIKKRTLNLNITPNTQNGDKSTSQWDNKGLIGFSITSKSDDKDMDYRDIPKYIKSYCKKFNIDIEKVYVFDDMNTTRDILNLLNINPFSREQWLDINSVLIAIGCGQTVVKAVHTGFNGIPSNDVAMEIYSLITYINTGYYNAYRDDDLPF